MLNKLEQLRKNKDSGFTIIEVMIVLAIAGLIILIVLLAIPALQRNSRNTAIKNDATALAAAVSEYKSNNDGKNPDGVSEDGVVSGGSGDASATAKLGANTVVSDTNEPEVGNLGAQIGDICPDSNGAPNRTVAIYYRIEVSGGEGAIKCIEA